MVEPIDQFINREVDGVEAREAVRAYIQQALAAERERCALRAYREIIAAVDDVRLANTIRDAIRERGDHE